MKYISSYLLALILTSLLTSCGGDFIGLPYPYEMDKECSLDIPEETIVYIKNQAEFDRLILSTDDGTRPEMNIPFSDGILMVVKGTSSKGIARLEKNLTQSSEDHYELSVQISQNLTEVLETWQVAYIIPQDYMDKVQLDLKYIQ